MAFTSETFTIDGVDYEITDVNIAVQVKMWQKIVAKLEQLRVK